MIADLQSENGRIRFPQSMEGSVDITGKGRMHFLGELVQNARLPIVEQLSAGRRGRRQHMQLKVTLFYLHSAKTCLCHLRTTKVWISLTSSYKTPQLVWIIAFFMKKILAREVTLSGKIKPLETMILCLKRFIVIDNNAVVSFIESFNKYFSKCVDNGILKLFILKLFITL